MAKLSKRDIKQGAPDWVIAQRVGEPVHSPTCQGDAACPLNSSSRRKDVEIRSNSNPTRGCHLVVPDSYARLLNLGEAHSRHELFLRSERRAKRRGERSRIKEKLNR